MVWIYWWTKLSIIIMPTGNALAVLRSIRPMGLQNVSFFTDIIGVTTGLNVDYNLNNPDTIYLVCDDNGIYYLNTNKSNKNILKVLQSPAIVSNAVGGNDLPTSFVKDYNNNIYIVERTTSNIKKIDAFGVETRAFAGSIVGNVSYINGDQGGFYWPQKIAVDSNNNLYVTDQANHAIRKIVYDKSKSNYPTVTTLAGPNPTGTGDGTTNNLYGHVDGNGSVARFSGPIGITVDLDDNIYVADSSNHIIRKITTNGAVTTIAGLGNTRAYADGVDSAARFANPTGICCDFDGNIYVTDNSNRRVRKITKVSLTTPSGAWTKLGQDINGEIFRYTGGSSTSMNSAGDRIVIGAFGQISPVIAGYVIVYSWDGSNWIRLGSIIKGENDTDNFGSSVSMNALGDRIVVGAPNNNVKGTATGSVRVYSWNGTSWIQLGSDIDGEAAGDTFGNSVSMNDLGDKIVVGAARNGGNGTNSGSVRVYSWNGTNWIQLGIDIDGENGGDLFGYSVSMNSTGDRIAVGAPHHSPTGTYQAGSVSVYSWNGSNWIKLGTNINGVANYDSLGNAVSMNGDGNKIIIGIPSTDFANANSGTVRVYSWNGSNWIQLGQDINGTGIAENLGAKGIAINNSGNIITIGSSNSNNGAGTNSGTVRVYSWNGTNWIQSGQNLGGTASGDLFGSSVSINSIGDKIIAGFPSGSVKVFGNNVAYNKYAVTTLAGKGTTNVDNEGDYFDAVFTNLGDISMMHDGNLLVVDNAEWMSGVNKITARRIKKIKNTTGYKTNFNITISTNRANIVLEDLLYRRGWDGKSPVTCTLTISSGVTVYGYTPDPSLKIGTKLNSSTINIINNGNIIGKGGDGGTFTGAYYLGAGNGEAGIYTRANINLINNGLIAGGGGGGAAGSNQNPDGGGGGGGGGYGTGGYTSTASNGTRGGNGSLLIGGAAGTGAAAGGNIANNGGDRSYTQGVGNTLTVNRGGLAGSAIDGRSYITLDPTSTGSLSGDTVN